VDQFLPNVYRFALRLVGNRQEAEDLTQETFLKAWRSREGLRDPQATRVWLFAIAANLWKDRLRRKARSPADAEPLDEWFVAGAIAPEREAIVREDLGRALAAMDGLPPRQREVLYLHACEGLALAEVAAVLATSSDAVKASLCEARKRLRRQFRQSEEEAGRGRRGCYDRTQL
jgi:RNA polymerase sigma-70 factor (ECF subfamily)